MSVAESVVESVALWQLHAGAPVRKSERTIAESVLVCFNNAADIFFSLMDAARSYLSVGTFELCVLEDQIG